MTSQGQLLLIQKLSISSIDATTHKKLVHDISFELPQNTIIALVGESGSGKTLTARAIMHLFASPSLAITSGSIIWKGRNLISLSHKEMRAIRGYEIAYIPQAPMSSMNPMMTVGAQLIEGFRRGSPQEAIIHARQLLKRCGFSDPERILQAYPHELSGGMKQRTVICMALMNSPNMIIADEPTTALDVSLQAEILSLLVELVREKGSSLLFITHDLGVVARVADHVLIMKNGHIIESGDVYQIFSSPHNDYTKLLLQSSTVDR